MKVIIFGATGTGKTTLGRHLSETLACAFLDSDDYYWKKTDPPFEDKIPLEVRNNKLQSDFSKHADVVVSGSLGTWSSYWDSAFDMGIHLVVSKDVRMERLAKREMDRYGDLLLAEEAIKKKSDEFLQWAARYEENDSTAHSYMRDQIWIQKTTFPIIEINSTDTNQARVDQILEKLKILQIEI